MAAKPTYRVIISDAEKVQLVVQYHVLGAGHAAKLHGVSRQTVYEHVRKADADDDLRALVDAELEALAAKHRRTTDRLTAALLGYLHVQVKRGKLTVAEACRALETLHTINAPPAPATTSTPAAGEQRQLGLPTYLTTPRTDAAAGSPPTTP